MTDPSTGPPPKADIGMHVEIEFVLSSGETEQLSLDIVPDSAADYAHGLLGAGTPLGRALIGATAGSRVIYTTGDIRYVRVLRVERGPRLPAEDLSQRREEAYRKAVEDSHRTNILLAAASMNSKWGAYDLQPLDGDGLPDQDNDTNNPPGDPPPA